MCCVECFSGVLQWLSVLIFVLSCWIYFRNYENMFCFLYLSNIEILQGCHNERDDVSNNQPHNCLPNRLCRRRSTKTSKLHVTGLCVRGIHRWWVNSPHKRPVTRKMFLFDDVIIKDLDPVYPARVSAVEVLSYLPGIFWFRHYKD